MNFSLTNRQLHDIVPLATSRASLKLPPVPEEEGRCPAGSAEQYFPARWQILLEYERKSRPTREPLLLCSVCFMLHPAGDFTVKEAARPAAERTCHPATPRLLHMANHPPLTIAVEVCPCWGWSSAQGLPEAKQFHLLTSEVNWTCTKWRKHACDKTCGKRVPGTQEPHIRIKLHLFRDRADASAVEITEYTWKEADSELVNSYLPYLTRGSTAGPSYAMLSLSGPFSDSSQRSLPRDYYGIPIRFEESLRFPKTCTYSDHAMDGSTVTFRRRERTFADRMLEGLET